MALHQYQLRRLRGRNALSDRKKQSSQFICSSPPLRTAPIARSAATAQYLPVKVSWTNWPPRPKFRPLEFRLAHLDNARLRAVLEIAAKRFRLENTRSKKNHPTWASVLPAALKKALTSQPVWKSRLIARKHDYGPPRLPGLRVRGDSQSGQPAQTGARRDRHGLGPALREEMRFENGQMLNASFRKYQVPRFDDVPELDIHLLNRPDLPPSAQAKRRSLPSLPPLPTHSSTPPMYGCARCLSVCPKPKAIGFRHISNLLTRISLTDSLSIKWPDLF